MRLLLAQWRQGNLSHFYVFESHPSTADKESFLKNQIEHFLSSILQEEKNITTKKACSFLKNGHPDILFINRSDRKSSEYTQKSGDLDPFFKFFHYSNYELKQRFVVIEEAHLIGKTLSNKLLKTLEEPTPNTTIFFLANKTSSFLPTILSRAVVWTLRDSSLRLGNFKGTETNKDFSSFLKEHESKNAGILNQYLSGEIELHEVLSQINKREDYEETFSLITQCMIDTHKRSKDKARLLTQLKWWGQSKTYHNSPQESLIELLRVIHSA